MKYCITLVVILLAGLSLQAAETKKKSTPKAKPDAEETAKVPAKIEAIAKSLTTTQRGKLLDVLNKGDDAALVAIPGIGETRAAAIKKARPFNDVTDVTKVEGVGEGTFAEMVAHAKAGFPKADSKEEPKKEETKKKEEPKKKSTTKKKSDSK
ncbi:MAG: helix-hairpin-helix domain-containing protein [Verrucomicrobiaceae bacterium]|nr:helix-hairpin-helix domain-containing protein [Verrucomicrobiaceae bacterium]